MAPIEKMSKEFMFQKLAWEGGKGGRREGKGKEGLEMSGEGEKGEKGRAREEGGGEEVGGFKREVSGEGGDARRQRK